MDEVTDLIFDAILTHNYDYVEILMYVDYKSDHMIPFESLAKGLHSLIESGMIVEVNQIGPKYRLGTAREIVAKIRE